MDAQQQSDTNVLADMANLERVLADDLSGERARLMVAYFDEVAKSAEQSTQQASHDAERQLASQLAQGFHAAKRVVAHVWETLHAASLPA
jgi:hypothetical protein